MSFNSLKISEHVIAQKPIIQGGMAIRVSTARLAAAVANCGGVGLIAISGMPEKEAREQIRLAKSLVKKPGGLIGVNIMFAASEFNNLVEYALSEKVDLIVFGAGFSRDIFNKGKELDIPIVPIVSSPKLAVMAKKLGATTIIVESGEAGGHLGTDRPITEIIPCVRKALDEAPASSLNPSGEVSLVAAGGITCGQDIYNIFQMGANGVQMATRFVLSNECEVHDNFKKVLLEATEDDLVSLQSPVGLPSNAIKTEFIEKLVPNVEKCLKSCRACLKKCSRSFCIIKALQDARNGDLQNGLFFSGTNVGKYNDILSVKEIFEKLEKEYAEAMEKAHKVTC